MEGHESKIIQELFRKANPEIGGPTPYLKTRVLARLREQKSRSHAFKWKWFAALSSASTLGLLAFFLLNSNPDFTARSGQPVLVKVELQNLNVTTVAYAEIELPEGVHFYSGKYPEMNGKRSLTLAWDSSFDQGKLPFVVKSDEAGSRKIHIFLKDGNNRVVGEKFVQIRFRG
jgi:hypothetical protein